MEVKCACSGDEKSVYLYACSGGSNVGQMTNEIAKELTLKGKGTIFCLAGVGGRMSGFIESSRAADARIALDGCPVSCARKTLEEAGLFVDQHIIITDLGMKKGPELKLKEEEIEKYEKMSSDIIHPHL